MLRARLDAAAGALMTPPDARADFTAPPGVPALVAPDSVTWRIFKNPVAMFVGGVAAVILEFAEPRVRDGVWNHSTFRTDPVRRLQRTGLAAMVTAFGARPTAEAMIAGVGRMHARVAGTTATGEPYAASDPALLTWVQATAAFGFLEAYAAYVAPLTAADRDAYYTEGQLAGRLYGADAPPGSQAELDALFAAMRPRFAASPIIFDFLQIMHGAKVLPRPLRSAQGLFVRAAVEIVPGWARRTLGLGPDRGLRVWERPVVRAAGAVADRLLLRSSPAVLSCRRLGLPEDFLYRRATRQA
jgi:uncharacterized protein (DUF2236 family)